MTGYLLSVEELHSGAEAERLYRDALQKLDPCRLEKVGRLRPGRMRSQAVGAGLLLQLAVQRMREPSGRGGLQRHRAEAGVASGVPSEFELLTVSGILERLGEPVAVSYLYGPHGKPDFADGMGHFNLSHSESLVCGVFAREEIGVDLQKVKPLRDMSLAERYFSEGEQGALRACADREQQDRLFYRLWVKKEAYGKLTGEGIAAVVSRDTDALSQQVNFQEYELPQGYCMAVCRYKKDSKLRNEACLE